MPYRHWAFTDLHLHLCGDGDFTWKTAPLSRLAKENGIGDPAWFKHHSGEKNHGENSLALITAWYRAHLAAGGRENKTAEYLVALIGDE